MKKLKSKRSEIEMTKLVAILLMIITVIFVLIFSRDIRNYCVELFNSFFRFLR
jgi:hypothetical protein